MENIKLFINEQKENNIIQINTVKEKISKNEYQVKEIEDMIVTLTKNIDTTYEIFSPYAMEKDKNITEIEKLNFKKNELNTEIVNLDNKLNECLKEKNKIDVVYNELMGIENKLANSVNETRKLVENNQNKITQKCNVETLKYLNYSNEKCNNYLQNSVLKKIETTLNKQTLILNMFDIDRERTKLELYKLNEETQNIKKSIEKKMFHVKHLSDNNSDFEKINVKEYIDNYIKLIDQKENIKIDYKASEENTLENEYIVNNMIEIVDEAINNATIHSNCSIINVDLFIDKKTAELSTNSNKENIEVNSKNVCINIDKHEDVHEISRINFPINNSTKNYNIIIKITDNGDGFDILNDNVLLSNSMYGINIMKYRSKLINAQLNIESTLGIGTTITIVY